MTVIVDVAIVCKNSNSVYKTMRKQFQSSATLMPRMHLTDQIWDKEREITGATYTPKDDSLYLGINPGIEECLSTNACKEMEEGYRSTGWRSAAEW